MKIFLDMVGCRLNQSEIEKFAFLLRRGGHEIVPKAENADVAIVNTCTVTASAAADSRKTIRRIARAGCSRILATGCLATVDPDQIQNLPSINRIIPNINKDALVDDLMDFSLTPPKNVASREPLPGKNKRTRAFIKVQDGCDNFCTFCITRIARGKSRSLTIEEIFRDVERALAGNVKEIVLTGVNLGAWGHDFDHKTSLSDLIYALLDEFQIPRIRLSSIEPWDINKNILSLLEVDFFCPHFHIPLQSGCDDTLRRMARRITTRQFEEIIACIRSKNAKAAITTDIIVGFPGENDSEFNDSLNFIRKMEFSGGHVFRYSPRIDTPAYSFNGQIDERVKKKRSKKVREIIHNSQTNFYIDQIGEKVEVLWESCKEVHQGDQKVFLLSGLSRNYIPISIKNKEAHHNQVTTVICTHVKGGKVVGMIAPE